MNSQFISENLSKKNDLILTRNKITFEVKEAQIKWRKTYSKKIKKWRKNKPKNHSNLPLAIPLFLTSKKA